jgi:hypothetical protein
VRQHIIHAALLDDFHLIIVQSGEGLTDGAHKPWLAGQRLRKVQGVTAGRPAFAVDAG